MFNIDDENLDLLLIELLMQYKEKGLYD